MNFCTSSEIFPLYYFKQEVSVEILNIKIPHLKVKTVCFGCCTTEGKG